MKPLDAPKKAVQVAPHKDSALSGRFDGAFYADCFARELVGAPYPTALAAYLAMSTAAPGWVNGLLLFRDRLVAPFGLASTQGFTANQKQAASLKCGDSLDFFTVLAIDPNELQLRIRDRDFTVCISVYLQNEAKMQTLYVASVVNTHTRLGRGYVRFILPFHRLVVRSLMNRLG